MPDFELKTEVATLDGVPEALHPFYVEDNGVFKLEDVSGLKSALTKTREEVKKLKGSKPNGDTGGLSPAEKAELEELRSIKSKAEEAEALRKGEYEKLLTKKDADYKKMIEERDTKLSSSEKRFNKAVKTQVATAAIAKLKGKPAALLPHVLNRLDVKNLGDEDYEVVVVDRDGTPRNSVKDPSKPMTVEEMIEKDFADSDDFMGLFEGRSKSGSGASGGQGKGAGGAVTITRTEAKDHGAYTAAKARATKAGVELQIID